MEYSVGSLADLISGNKTPNKTKVVQKVFKREPVEPIELSEKKATKKIKSKDLSLGLTETVKKEKLQTKCKKESEESTFSNGTQPIKKSKKIKTPKLFDGKSNNAKNKNIEKSTKNKTKKRKLDESIGELADSDVDMEESPKKQKLSENEKNAASRIKNKKNQENKNSSEYKDKTLFVGNIPINIKKEKIKKLFRKYGVIESVRIRGIPVADPKVSKKLAAIKQEFHPDRNTVYAYIRFKNSEDAKKAEAEDGQLFMENHLRVQYCESTDKPDESKAIFVGNLPFKAEEEELWNLFKPCGPISHVRIVRDGRTGMGKGFGYVNFKDTDAVQLAVEMEKVMLKDRELRITLCDSSRATKKKQGKKPRYRNSRPNNSKGEGNGEQDASNQNRFKREKHGNKGGFAGSKFNDKDSKKKKFSKATMEKKTLAKKLVAPKLEKS